MNAVEFTTELTGGSILTIPSDVAAHLPKVGRARIIVLTDLDVADADWRALGYDQFMRDDPPEDAVYQALR